MLASAAGLTARSLDAVKAWTAPFNRARRKRERQGRGAHAGPGGAASPLFSAWRAAAVDAMAAAARDSHLLKLSSGGLRAQLL